ncbi:MAG: hypothetical protein V2I82_10140 [Halieaceae bacterium]|jgi:chromosome segregation ATPase|nr:hypothetical protein [Halieaceae bacterium]
MDRDQLIEKLKTQLDEVNASIDTLEARYDAASADVEEEVQQRLRDAKAQREKAEQKLREIREAGDEAWEDLKEDAEHTWKALKNSVNYFKSHFK